MRSGALFILVVLAATVGVASARADGTTVTTTTTTGTTTTTAAPSYAPLAPAALPSSCLGAGGALIEEPGQAPIALDAPAAALGPSGYPADASIVAFGAANGNGSPCRTGSVSLRSVSLFGGAITARAVGATGGHGSVAGLQLDGAPLSLSAGETTFVDGWGRLTVGGNRGRLSAPLVLTLDQAHGALPAGTVVLVGFAEAPVPAVQHTTTAKAPASQQNQGQTPPKTAPAVKHAKLVHRTHHHKKTKKMPQPLKVTPDLGRSHYDFPVDGGASYVDTYGAGRSDIYDGWHHGDDLFAPLGTPVVAVERGTLSLVGWNELGGWRLWLTDNNGNSFYYAHLSGYSRWILHHRHVKAGQVIGFLGRTGDAYTTEPHLHFEVHPHQLLRLGYDGAVDPTSYLHSWTVVHVPLKEMPRPARLRAPAGVPAQEAAVVWHELLVARNLVPSHAASSAFAIRRRIPNVVSGTGATLPLHVDGAVRVAEQVATPSSSPWPTAVAAVVLALGAFALVAVGRRRRWAVPATPSRLADLARVARRARAPR